MKCSIYALAATLLATLAGTAGDCCRTSAVQVQQAAYYDAQPVQQVPIYAPAQQVYAQPVQQVVRQNYYAPPVQQVVVRQQYAAPEQQVVVRQRNVGYYGGFQSAPQQVVVRQQFVGGGFRQGGFGGGFAPGGGGGIAGIIRAVGDVANSPAGSFIIGAGVANGRIFGRR